MNTQACIQTWKVFTLTCWTSITLTNQRMNVIQHEAFLCKRFSRSYEHIEISSWNVAEEAHLCGSWAFLGCTGGRGNQESTSCLQKCLPIEVFHTACPTSLGSSSAVSSIALTFFISQSNTAEPVHPRSINFPEFKVFTRVFNPVKV